MITSEDINYYNKKIMSLGRWYHPIEFTKGLQTPSKYSYKSIIHGVNKWNFILRRNLPDNLSGKKILDLGCASGLYSLLCAREGAEVIAIENNQRAYEQALLTREIFSKLDGIDYSSKVKIIKEDITKINWNEINHFDVVMALNILYWLFYSESPDEDIQKRLDLLIENIKKHTKLFVIQSEENKYYYRKKIGKSVIATNAKTTVAVLKKHNFTQIRVDKPIHLKALFTTIINKIKKRQCMAEIDRHKPIFYTRPIVVAKTE